MTSKYRKLTTLFTVLSFLLCVGPFAAYAIMALCGGALVVEKVALVSTVFIVLIMTIISVANKMVLKSRLWILLIGLYLCLDNIMGPLMVIAICQTVDELIVSPLAKAFRTKLTIHKELDKRLTIN